MYQERVVGMSHLPDGMLSYTERTWRLQDKLYRKAKQESGFKFYILYDKVFLPYVLHTSWDCVRRNGGAPGVDGQRVEDVEAEGIEGYLQALGEELRKRTYRASAVKRVWIPKSNGDQRPLGIPTLRDRIVQTACKMILEPIFESDFSDSSHGFRPHQSAGSAVSEIRSHLQSGKTEIYDADLSKYFDTIPHDKLKVVLRGRISDPRIIALINQWLKAPVYEDGRYTGGKKNKLGTPQGGVISPLLANIYMNLLDQAVSRQDGLFHRSGIRIVRYADDFVLMGEKISEHAEIRLRDLLSRMGLSINESKTRKVNAVEEGFNFLGFTFRYDRDLQGRGWKYLNIHPGKKSEQNVRDHINDYLHRGGHYPAVKVAEGLNMILRGWLNYFTIEKVSYTGKSRRGLRWYLINRLNQYYNRKSQRRSSLYGQQAYDLLIHQYGLIDVVKYKMSTP